MWLKELNPLNFLKNDSKNWTFFQYDSKNWTLLLQKKTHGVEYESKGLNPFSIWLKELNFFLLKQNFWLKELNLFSKKKKTLRIEPFLKKVWVKEYNLLDMNHRIQPFLRWVKELNLFLNVTKEWIFFWMWLQ